MRYDSKYRLCIDAERVSNGVAANQSQESLDDQLKDLHVLAVRFGLYDAADHLHNELERRERYERDYGEREPSFEAAMNNPSITLEQAIAQLSLRKQNLDHIMDDPSRKAERRIREDEIDRTLEIVRRVNVVATQDDWGKQPRGNWPDSTFGSAEQDRYDPNRC